MHQRVGQQVRQQLRDARRIAVDRRIEVHLDLDRPIGPGRAQLIDHLQQRRRQRLSAVARRVPARRRDGRAQNRARCRSGPPCARRSSASAATIVRALPVEPLLGEQRGAGVDRRQRIAQVVAEHGDELLAQLGRIGARRTAPLRSPRGAPAASRLKRDQLGEQLEHADDLRRFLSLRRLAGRWRTACRRSVPSRRKIGIEM